MSQSRRKIQPDRSAFGTSTIIARSRQGIIPRSGKTMTNAIMSRDPSGSVNSGYSRACLYSNPKPSAKRAIRTAALPSSDVISAPSTSTFDTLPKSLKLTPKETTEHSTVIPSSRSLFSNNIASAPSIEGVPLWLLSFVNAIHAEPYLPSSAATTVKAKSRSQSPPASPESRARSDARGKNYSAQNVKRKPLSGAGVSSRKRSSGA
jgi:hypothetical protein